MDAAARLYLDQEIAPARSLPKQGLLILLGALIVLNMIVGTLFLLMGAFPVPVFLGLDVVGVWLAFAISNRQARGGELVQITAEEVKVLRQTRKGPSLVWTSPTAFTRVQLEDTGRYGKQVRLVLSGKRLTLGRMLGPTERASLADAVERAIGAARAERWEPRE